MISPLAARISPIQTMADGTVKQINPFSGTEVWTVPGRGNRPITQPPTDTTPLTEKDLTDFCAFCPDRRLETPPEKSRLIRTENGFQIRTGLSAAEVETEPALFRRVPNLFEIVTYEYWQANYEYCMDTETADRMNSYLSTELGRRHVHRIIETKRKASGLTVAELSEKELLTQAECFFGGGHDVIIGPHHFQEGADNRSQLASSGTLTPEEHFGLIWFTAESARDLYKRNRYAKYVAVFQN